MATLTVTERFEMPPQAAWERASDLSRFGQWLTIHDGWRSPLPETIEQGLELTSVIAVRGMRNRIDWTLEEYTPPSRIALRGDGKGGTEVAMSLSIEPSGGGSVITMDVEFSNPLARGPVAAAVRRSLKGDITKSMGRLAALPA